MNRSVVQGAVGAAVACGAFVTGSMCGGVAVAHAGLLGIGGGGDDVNVLGIEVLDGGSRTARPGATAARVNAVSTAPSARSVIIRTKPAVRQPVSEVIPAVSGTTAQQPATALGSSYIQAVPAAPPAVVPHAVTPPSAPVLEAPAPQALPATTTNEPGPTGRIGPADSLSPPTRIPDTFRVGYAEYLRAATTSEIVAAALPGAAGLAGFTILGAYAGYRQAKALKNALLAPVPTSILL